MKKSIYTQVIPLVLTVVTFFIVTLLLGIEIHLLNIFVKAKELISLVIRYPDIIIGLTIYIKTAIDFAIYIGRLMAKYTGWKNRIMIEIGTALGNALGTMIVLMIWELFREIHILMAVMILLASFVLIRLAEEGLEHATFKEKTFFANFTHHFENILKKINSITNPLLSKFVPSLSVSKDETQDKSYKQLFLLSFSIPFILGLDDFAGYIPLFNVVNVFGFGIGVFLGHMVLNLALFISPKNTIKAVKNSYISFFGSIAFIGIAAFGFFESLKLLGIIPH